MVVTRLPTAIDTGSTHERTALPSRCTVHAPHCAAPQPNLVPVNPRFSRNTHNSGVVSSTSIATLAPLISRSRATSNLLGTSKRRSPRAGGSLAARPARSRGARDQFAPAAGASRWRRLLARFESARDSLGVEPAVVSHSRQVSIGWMALGTFALLAFVVVLLTANSAHRRTPEPAGMVLRLSAREGGGIFDRFTVEVASLDPVTLAVVTPPTRALYSYPGGQLLRSEPAPPASDAANTAARSFDFDGDGTLDRVRVGIREECGLVQVLSGVNGDVLFEDRDDLEYEDCDRAFPLGDLDGDGFAELALVHPREDRSRYDINFWDWLLGIHSWVTV